MGNGSFHNVADILKVWGNWGTGCALGPGAWTEAPRSRMLVGYSRRGRFARQLRAVGIRAKGEDVKSRTRRFIPQGARAAIVQVSIYFGDRIQLEQRPCWFGKRDGKGTVPSRSPLTRFSLAPNVHLLGIRRKLFSLQKR